MNKNSIESGLAGYGPEKETLRTVFEWYVTKTSRPANTRTLKVFCDALQRGYCVVTEELKTNDIDFYLPEYPVLYNWGLRTFRLTDRGHVRWEIRPKSQDEFVRSDFRRRCREEKITELGGTRAINSSPHLVALMVRQGTEQQTEAYKNFQETVRRIQSMASAHPEIVRRLPRARYFVEKNEETRISGKDPDFWTFIEGYVSSGNSLLDDLGSLAVVEKEVTALENFFRSGPEKTERTLATEIILNFRKMTVNDLRYPTTTIKRAIKLNRILADQPGKGRLSTRRDLLGVVFKDVFKTNHSHLMNLINAAGLPAEATVEYLENFLMEVILNRSVNQLLTIDRKFLREKEEIPELPFVRLKEAYVLEPSERDRYVTILQHSQYHPEKNFARKISEPLCDMNIKKEFLNLKPDEQDKAIKNIIAGKNSTRRAIFRLVDSLGLSYNTAGQSFILNIPDISRAELSGLADRFFSLSLEQLTGNQEEGNNHGRFFENVLKRIIFKAYFEKFLQSKNIQPGEKFDKEDLQPFLDIRAGTSDEPARELLFEKLAIRSLAKTYQTVATKEGYPAVLVRKYELENTATGLADIMANQIILELTDLTRLLNIHSFYMKQDLVRKLAQPAIKKQREIISAMESEAFGEDSRQRLTEAIRASLVRTTGLEPAQAF